MTLAATCATALLAVQVFLLGRGSRTGARRREQGALWLREAGVGLSPARFRLLRGTLVLLALAVLVPLTGSPAVAAVPAAALWSAPRVVLARRRHQRLRRLQQAWPDGLRELAASVSAGMSLPQALLAVARSGPQPLQEALARLPGLMPAVGFQAALESARADAADPTTDRIVEVLLLAHERGGSLLPEILADLSEATAADLHTAERIATAQLELRINARVVFALPWLVLCALTARPGPFREFYASTAGLPVVALGAALSGLGILIVGRLSHTPVEPRLMPGTERAT